MKGRMEGREGRKNKVTKKRRVGKKVGRKKEGKEKE